MRPSPIDTTPSTPTTPIPTTPPPTTRPSLRTRPSPTAKPTSSSTTSSSSSSNNDSHIQPSSQPPPSPHNNRSCSAVATKLRSLPYKKIARYLRLLVLIFAFVTLILDAITLSFEVKVMNLDLNDISAQAAFLLCPDVLAMVFFVVLLIYPMRHCFIRQYDLPNEDEPLDEEQDIQANISETSLGHRSRSSSRQRRRRGDRSSSDIQDRYHEPRSSRKQGKQRAHGEQDQQDQQGLGLDPEIPISHHLYPDNHEQPIRVPTITITMAHTPSPSPPPPPSPPHPPTHTQPQPQPQATLSSSSSRSSSPLSLEKPSFSADIQEVEQYIQDDKERRKQRWFYSFVGLRIFFGLGLVALALYWPASGRKPPMGYLPRDMWQQKEKPAWIGRGRPPLLSPSPSPSPSLVKPSSTILPSPTVSPTTLMINSVNTNSSRRSYPDPDPELKSYTAARTNRSHGPGNNNNRNATAHWCSIEESYGDNQSALVFCQVKHIRPAMVYFWASLILVEIGMAYMAGELTRKNPKATPDQLSLDPEKRDYSSSGHVNDSGAGVGRLDTNHVTGARR